MISCLVTAKNSFVAKNIIEQLPYGFTALTRKELDLVETKSVDAFFENKYFDVVIHTARVGGRRNEPDLETDALENIIMFENLLVNRHHYGILINIGSGAEIKPKTYYGAAKAQIARYIRGINTMYNLRCWGVWGKYEAEDRFPTYCQTHNKVKIEDKLMRYIHVNDLIKKIEWIIETRPKQRLFKMGKIVRLSEFARELNPNIKIAIIGNKEDYV